MLDVSPPDVGGFSGRVEIFSVTVEITFFPCSPNLNAVLGSLTIAWVTRGMSSGSVRNCVGIARLVSGNGTGLCGGAIVNGVMLTAAMFGAVLMGGSAVPYATNDVPWGMLARRATVVGSCGLVVTGT